MDIDIGTVTSKGYLVKTDVPTKVLIMSIHKSYLARGITIVLKELDDCHVLINTRYRDLLSEQLEVLFNRNTYERKQGGV